MAVLGRDLALADEDFVALESWARSTSLRAGLVERARIVLAIADGEGTSAVARRLSVSRPTVIKWRERFRRGRSGGAR
jgi:transposase-like protein